MEHELFCFDAVQAQIVQENKRWIEELFHVEIVIKNDTSVDPVFFKCAVVLNTHNTLEILDKTKKYIAIITDILPDLVTITDNFESCVVEAVLGFKAPIEYLIGTVVFPGSVSDSLVVKGLSCDIDVTNKLLDELEQWQSDDKDLATFPVEEVIQQCLSEIDVLDSQSALLLIPRKYLYSKDLSQENQNQNGSDSGLKVLRAFQNLSIIESDRATNVDDDFVYYIKTIPDYETKVQFALKLGYGEEDLILALRNVGESAGQNELLSELIKNCAGKLENVTEDAEDRGTGPDLALVEQRSQLHGNDDDPFRHIIIDGSNLAMSHGAKDQFSCRGIQLAVDWFRERGHTHITVFVPQWRKETTRTDSKIKDQHILTELEKDGIVVFTPSRRIGGKRVICYDDRYILNLAVDTDGIVVSNDNYRDLMSENEKYKKVVEERLLMYTFADDRFMPPDDPLGRNGPTLDNFLLKVSASPDPLPPVCPYGSKKCTYGNKCKYYHPERRTQPHRPVTEKLAEQAKHLQELRRKETVSNDTEKKKLTKKTSLGRTKSGPAETNISQTPISFSFGSPPGQEKGRDFNQKLTESRLKMEKEKSSYEGKLPFPRTPDKKTLQKPKNSKTSAELLERSSPIFGDFRQQGYISPRESSPVNLSVGGHLETSETGQKFLSGHLLLAKKLSDEANESEMLKKKGKLTNDDGSKMISPLAYSPANASNDYASQTRQQPKPKQKLARVCSLPPGEDPRHVQRHAPLDQTHSYDPRGIAAHQDEMPRNLNQGFGSYQQPPLSPSSFGIGKPISRNQPYEYLQGHTALARMQSAPDPFLGSKPSFQGPPIMTRQNSSSDTQLNKILCHHDFEGNTQEHFMARGQLDNHPPVLRDTSGLVKFQIGNQGPFQTHPSLHASNSMPVFRQDYRFHQPYMSEYPSHGFPNQSASPFVKTSFGQLDVAQTGYDSQRHQLQHQSHFVNQSIVDSQSALPSYQHYFPPPGTWSQTVSQNTPQSALISAHQSIGFGGPFPIDAPIMPTDCRYKLYVDLCRLFPEEKVRATMNQHPETNNPDEVCAYLIGAKK
ncbi:uncharacterized protein LOC127848938 [Dreissena polymorpha]|uniref:C3H1-type domain-containing protein n=1 Tax=Dreissena polymorpha TaxID=45954 RepID=A0A9D4N3T9_DREPO|nr:uncharacterized protein LOC127848938 [Dreissena polymorpha]KAH3889128.1 hypothetical protein DPMN_013178 [Dreissena polymorpha]